MLSDATASEIPSQTAVAPRDAEERRSSLLLPGHLRGVPRSGPDEGLEGSTLRIDAQRHPFALLVLRDEAMDQLFSLPH